MSQSRSESKESPKAGLAKLSELVLAGKLADIKNLVADAKASKGWQWHWSDEKYVECAMRDAILSGQIEVLRLFLAEGMSGDAWAYEKENHGSIKKLIAFASQKGDLATVELLVEHHADIKPRNEYYKRGDDSGMRAAIEFGHAHIVDFLLANGASADGVFRGLVWRGGR